MAFDPKLEALIRERSSQSAFSQWMGYELASLGDGECEIRLPIKDHHLNPGGIVHGGVIASILDSSIGLALRTKIGSASHVTAQLDIHYISAGRGDLLIGRGTAVHTGRRMGYGEARVFSRDERLVATGAATFFVLETPLPGLGDRPQGDA